MYHIVFIMGFIFSLPLRASDLASSEIQPHFVNCSEQIAPIIEDDLYFFIEEAWLHYAKNNKQDQEWLITAFFMLLSQQPEDFRLTLSQRYGAEKLTTDLNHKIGLAICNDIVTLWIEVRKVHKFY